MKKKLIILVLAAISSVFCAFGFAACGGGKHTHTYSDEWSSDKDYHWHIANCEHTEEKSDLAPHIDANNNGECDVCLYRPMTVTVGGTYYYCEDEISDEQIYFTLKNGKWSDDEGLNGDYSISGNVVTLYIVIDNEKMEYAVGTVSGEDITMDVLGADIIYRKGDDADGKPKEKTLSYALSSDKSYYIVKGIGGLTGEIEIPDEYKRKPVKEISENAFANCKVISSIVIGNNLTTIGKKAFYNCANLTEAVLGESVTTIPDNAFEGCSNLITITLGSDISRFGEKAFYSCRALKDIYFNGTVSDWAQIDFTSNPIYDNNIYIVGNNTATSQYPSRNLYINGEILKDVNITNAAHISKNAFLGYTQLENLTIGGIVSEIGDNAFYGCSALETLKVTGGVKTIGKASFRFCKKLSSVVLSDSVNIIGESAFDSCENLITVDTGNGVSYISYGAFMSCEKLSSLILGNSVAEICEGAFYSCEALTTVTIPSSTIFIGKEAFSYTGLTSAIFKSTTGWVANKSDALTSEQLSDTSNAARLLITSILDKGYVEAEWEKPTLTYSLSSDKTYYIVNNSGTVSRSIIVIPEKYNDKPVRALAQNAFKDCKSLISLSLPGCMLDIPVNAFSGCTSLEDITIRGYLVSSYEEVYASADGVLYNADFTQLIYMPLAKSEITITGVKEVSESRFEYNESLKKVTIGNGVESIGYCAFSGCKNLTEVTIPVSVKNIDRYAFSNCNNLKINYNGTLSDWCNLTINGNFPDGTELYINNEKVTNLVIPKDITKINDYIFSNISSIKNVVLHSSLKEIGEQAFYNCSSLAEITIPSTVEKIGGYAFGDCNSLVIYCEVSERPNGWSYNWESDSNVIWSCKNNNVDQSGNTYVVVDGIRYALKDGKAIVAKQMSEISRTVTIPANISSKGTNYKVTEIESYAFARSSIKSIIIPNTITKIGNYAFSECKGLIKVTFPDRLTDIGTCAFKNCVGITEIALPTSVKNVGSNSFSGCPIIKATVPTVAISYLDKDNLKTIIILSGKSVTGLKNCTTLTSVTIADGVEEIGNSAFYGCTGITEITLPNSISNIGSEAFRNCVNLKDISFSNQITNIANSAFSGCTGLTEINLPDSVQNIGNYAFSGCTNITNITLSTNLESLGSGIFNNCIGLTEINIPDSVTKIGEKTFNGCTALTKIVLSKNLISIANNLFNGCTSLTKINIPDSVNSIGDEVFNGCVNLIEIKIPDSVTIIGSAAFEGTAYYLDESNWQNDVLYINNHIIAANNVVGSFAVKSGTISIATSAFEGCAGLTVITLPNSLKGIGHKAFKDCAMLVGVTIPDGVTVIGDYAFYGCKKLADVKISSGLTSLGSYAFYDCASLTKIDLPDALDKIGTYTFAECAKLTEFTIPKNVVSIGEKAFYRCSSMTKVIFSDNVNYVGYQAFTGCNALKGVYISDLAAWCNIEFYLQNYTSSYPATSPMYYTSNLYLNGELITDLIIPDGVTKINTSTFCNGGFKSITLPSSVTEIANAAFEDCNNITEIVIPDSVKSIGQYAFFDCNNLTTITIGSSVTRISDHAFRGCDKLVEIFNKSKINIVAGSEYNGYVGRYAINIYTPDKGNKKTATTSDGFIVLNDEDISYVLGYIGSQTEITLPATINGKKYEIFNFAFYKLDNIIKVVLSNNATAIGNYAFYDCKALKMIELGNSIVSIGNYAFDGCSSLESILLSETLESIGGGAFINCSSLSTIFLGQNVKTIGSCTFQDCDNLTILAAADSRPSGWDSSWNNNGRPVIWNSTNKSGVTENGFEWALLQDGSATITGYNGTDKFVKIPSNISGYAVKSIGSRAFYNNKDIVKVTIPTTIETIQDSAFYGCNKLVEVYNLSNIYIRSNYNSSNNGYISKYALNVYTDSYGGSKLSTRNDLIIFDDGVSVYVVGYSGNQASVTFPDELNGKAYGIYTYAFYNCKSITSLIISSGVTEIGEYAFAGCENIENIKIEEGLSVIGKFAFKDCAKPTEIVVPNSVTTMGSGVFSGWSNLVSITLPFIGSSSTATTLSQETVFGYIFGYISSSGTTAGQKEEGYTIQYYSNSWYYHYAIPETIRKVIITGGKVLGRSFYNCDFIEQITLPASIGAIGSNAFYRCTGLNIIYFTGTSNEWNKLSNSGSAIPENTTVYFFSETQPSTSGNYWHYVEGEIVVWTKEN